MHDNLRFNNDEQLKCYEVSLHDGDTFVGVLVEDTENALLYAVDKAYLFRRVAKNDVKCITDVHLPTMVFASIEEKKGAGMLGKHTRYTYRVPRSKKADILIPAYPPQSLPEQIQYEKKEVKGETLALTVNTKDWFLALFHLFSAKIECSICQKTTKVVQMAVEKKDRYNELFTIPQGATLDQLSDPLVIGPAWLSSLPYWQSHVLPHPFTDTKTYTWQQLAKVVYSMLTNAKTHNGEEIEHIAFPEPFNSYFYERVHHQKGLPYNKKYTKSQPTLAHTQIKQLYNASYFIDGPGKHYIHQVGGERLKQCCKVILLTYKFRGFYVRQTRNYEQTGKNSCVDFVTRNWSDPKTRKIYKGVLEEKMKTLPPASSIASVGLFPNETVRTTPPLYRGKYPERQGKGASLYVVTKKRRNVSSDDDDAFAIIAKQQKLGA